MKPSQFSKDTQEFLKLLSNKDVKYLIVGGEAVIYYGSVRLTGDVDFFFDASEKNTEKMYDALDQFWEGNIPGISSSKELMESGIIIQFGVQPNRIDLVNRIDGVTFDEAWVDRTQTTIKVSGKTIPVFFIGLEQLIKNKESIKRPKDLEDLKYLLKAKERGEEILT